MLYPQSNPFRQMLDLSGIWAFRFDPDNAGSAWAGGFTGSRPIAVPASWNDQFEDGRDYLGPAWYQTRFDLPWGWDGRRIRLRFGSVNYLAEVWLNGQRLGQHESGHLPFEFDASGVVRSSGNILVVRVEGLLAPDRVPPGNIPLEQNVTFDHPNLPATSFDFFPFCGIHRPVLLYATPREEIRDVTVITEIQGSTGIVRVNVETATDSAGASIQGTLSGHGIEITRDASTGALLFEVPNAALWAPGKPNLYELTVDLRRDGDTVDRYQLPVGIRTIAVKGDQLLLNGQPVQLKGFGRHEDFPVIGRGLFPPLILKDYALMQWVGANSFRTTHYPYSEQMMDLADQLGFLIIDEIPAVGLFFKEEGLQRRLSLCRQQIQELIARDKNHPSVIMWSVANEPHSWNNPKLAPAKPFFRELYDLAKTLDTTRPVTLVSMIGEGEESFEFMDVVCMNRYFGWYVQVGDIGKGVQQLSADLDAIHARFPKPLILTEFGADAVAGSHAQPPEMFTEEYQAEMISRYLDVLGSKPYVVGAHVWNFADFKTAQAIHRVGGLNLKGVFTRDRRPKLAAHRLRERWT